MACRLLEKEVGKTIGSLITSPQNSSKILDVEESIFTPIEEAQNKAIRSGDKLLFERLEDIKKGLTQEFGVQEVERGRTIAPTGPKNLKLNPEETQKMKIQVGDDTRWTGQAFDNDVNKVRVKIYRNLDNLLDKNVKGIEKLNQRYANLLTAEKSLEKSNKLMQRLVMSGLRSTGLGGIVAGAEFARGQGAIDSILEGIATSATFSFLGSTAVKTRMAQLLNKLPTEEAGFLTNIFKNIYLGTRSGSISNPRGNSMQGLLQ